MVQSKFLFQWNLYGVLLVSMIFLSSCQDQRTVSVATLKEYAKELTEKINLKKDPRQEKQLNKKALALHKQGLYQKSAVVWLEAARVSPGIARPYYNLACVSALMGRARLAVQFLKVAFLLGSPTAFKKKIKSDKDFAKIRNQKVLKRFLKKPFKKPPFPFPEGRSDRFGEDEVGFKNCGPLMAISFGPQSEYPIYFDCMMNYEEWGTLDYDYKKNIVTVKLIKTRAHESVISSKPQPTVVKWKWKKVAKNSLELEFMNDNPFGKRNDTISLNGFKLEPTSTKLH